MTLNLKKTTLAVAAALAVSVPAGSAVAATYLGSWEVDDGPGWTSQPLAYTGQQAAALLFAGVTGDSDPTHYAVSTRGSDLGTINHMAWYSILGISGGTMFGENYVAPASSQAPGYYYSGNPYPYSVTDAASAYVEDNAHGSAYTNYAFYVGAVPEPETYAMMLAGLGLLGAMKRRARK